MIDAGKIGICKGKFMASMDEIIVTVRGKGGHGAQPHMNNDPVIISAPHSYCFAAGSKPYG
jgi:amidohydrolase